MENIRQFNRIYAEVNSVFHEAALKMGLSDSAMLILYCMGEMGESCPLSEVVYYTGISKQTVNSALRKLEDEGILYLECWGTRRKTVCLTEKGKALVEKNMHTLQRRENEIFSQWTEEERRLFFDLNQRYLKGLKQIVKEMDV